MINFRPETHITFDYLPDLNNRIIVFGYGAGRMDPDSPGRFEIRVFFAEPDINDPNLKNFDKARRFRQYVPLTDFRFFGNGNVFKNQRHVGYNREARVFKADKVHNYCVTELNFIPDGARIIGSFGFDQHMPDYSLRDPHLTIMHDDTPIFVPPLEPIRFFLSSFGHFGATFLNKFDQWGSPSDVYHEGETGWINNDTYQIAPKGDYCDIASAVQLALLLTNSDLMQLLVSLGHLCSSLQDSKKTMTTLFPFPDLSKDLKFMALEKTLFANSSPMQEGLICRRIISDSRPLQFKNLKIILKQPRRSISRKDKDKDKDEPSKKYGPLKSILIKKGDVKKKKGHYIWGNLPGLIESFPMLGEVSLAVIRNKSLSSGSQPQNGSGEGRAAEGSSSSNPGPVVTPAITFKSPLMSRQLFGGQDYQPGLRSELFSRTLNSIPDEIGIDTAISQLSPENVKRFQILFDSQDTEFDTDEDNYAINKGRSFVLALPNAWGGLAKTESKRGRLVASIEMSIGGFYYYCLEIELSKGVKNVALGVIAATNGRRLGLYDFGCILSHSVSRVRLRGKKRKPSESYIGIWPDEAEYVDVVGDRIIHSEKIKHPHALREKIASIISKYLL